MLVVGAAGGETPPSREELVPVGGLVRQMESAPGLSAWGKARAPSS